MFKIKFKRPERITEEEWKILRYPFWFGSIAAIILVVAYLFGSLDAQRFDQQIWVFRSMGIVMFVLGVSFGYKYPKARNVWLLADAIWIGCVFLTIDRMVYSVENYVVGSHAANGAHINIFYPYFHIWLLMTAFCFRSGKIGAEYLRNIAEHKKDATQQAREEDEKERRKGGKDDWR